MRSVPKFLVGMFKNTQSNALEEIIRSDGEVNQERVEIVLNGSQDAHAPAIRVRPDPKGQVGRTVPVFC